MVKAPKLVSVVVCAGVIGCAWWQAGERAAVLRLQVGDKAVYFKRRAWGRNGAAVVISATSDWRGIPRPGDYTWTAEEPPLILYREQQGALHIWGNGTDMWTPPIGNSFPVPVVFHEVDIETAVKLSQEPQVHGIKRLRNRDWPPGNPPIEPVPLDSIVPPLGDSPIKDP